MTTIDILPSLIPVCPDCRRVMLRAFWDSARPQATCQHCQTSHYYSRDGRIVMSAKIRRPAA